MIYPPPLFEYGLTPNVVPHSEGPEQESTVTLMVGVTNDTGRDVEVRYIKFAVPTGDATADLAASAPFEVSPARGVAWDVYCDAQGVVTATPTSLEGLRAGESVAFFAKIVVNGSAGMSKISVWEQTDDLRQSDLQVFKTPPGLAITRFQASPIQLQPGMDSCVLDWETTGAQTVTLSHGGTSERVGDRGPKEVRPRFTTLYTLTASDGATSTHQQLTVYVPQVAIHSFAATPDQIEPGSGSTLSWLLSNAEKAVIRASGATPDPGPVDPLKGSIEVWPTELTTTYTLTAGGFGNTLQAPAIVDLLPSGSFSATPRQLPRGGAPELASTLRWRVDNAVGVSIEPGIGPVAEEGDRPVKPAATTDYVLNAKRLPKPLTARVVVAPAFTALRYSADEFLNNCQVNWTAVGAPQVRVKVNQGGWTDAPAIGSARANWGGAIEISVSAGGWVNHVVLWCAAGLAADDGRPANGARAADLEALAAARRLTEGPGPAADAAGREYATIDASCAYGLSSVGATARLNWSGNAGGGTVMSGSRYPIGQSGTLDFPIGPDQGGNAWYLYLGMQTVFVRTVRAETL